VAACALMVVALARPQWGYQWQELRSEGLSVVVVLDVSLSMNAEDVSPNRMERARREIRDLTSMLAGDRVGLVVFAGGAHAQMPLTVDYGTLDRLARQASPSMLRAQGSDLGAAIDKAVELLGTSEGDQAIVVISDGEDQLGLAGQAAQRAADAGIVIYAMGVGTADGAPIPVSGGGFKMDQSGKMVISRLNEAPLVEIAEIGLGAYVHSVAGIGDMRSIYVDEIRGKLDRTEQGLRRDKIWTERYQWFLGLALLGLVLRQLWGAGVVVLRSVGVVVLFGFGMNTAQAQSTDSLDVLLRSQTENPDDLELAERLGHALFEAGRYDESASVLSSVADRSADQSQRARSRFNAGLAEYHGGQLVTASQDWQRVLQDNPDHASALKNASAVEEEIRRRLQEDPPEDNQDNSPGEDDANNQEDQQSEGTQQDQGSEQESGETSPEGDEANEAQQTAESSSDGSYDPKQTQDADNTDLDSNSGIAQESDPNSDPNESDEGVAATPSSEMSEETAARLLDSVDEGTPRVVINPDSRGGPDW